MAGRIPTFACAALACRWLVPTLRAAYPAAGSPETRVLEWFPAGYPTGAGRQAAHGVPPISAAANSSSHACTRTASERCVSRSVTALPHDTAAVQDFLRQETQDASAVAWCLSLHTLPDALAVAALRVVREAGLPCYVVDFCLAERNICLPAVALARGVMACDAAAGACAAYMRAGGLEGLLARADMRPAWRRSLWGGALTLALCPSVQRA